MSIEVMSLVWNFAETKDASDRLVLLAIADRADDDGYAFPGIKSLAKKCRIHERSVQRALNRLCDSGELQVQHSEGAKTAFGHTNRYRIMRASGNPIVPRGGVMPPGGVGATPPVASCPKGGGVMPPNTSYDSSGKTREPKELLAKASTGTNSRELQNEFDLGLHDSPMNVPARKQRSEAQDDFLWPRQRLMATLPGWKPRKSDKTDKAIKWFLKKHGRDEFDKLMRAVAESDFLMARNRFTVKGDGKTPHERKTPSFIFGVNDDGEKHSDLILDGYYSNENTATWWLPKAPPPTSYSADDFIKVKLSDSTGTRVVTMKKSDVGDKDEKYLILSRDYDGIPTVMDQTHILESQRKEREQACKT